MLLILKYILLLLIPKSNFVIRVILLYILSLFLLFIPILLLLLLWILFVYCYGIDAWSIKYLNQPILHLKCRESKASAMVMGYSIELIYFTTHMFVFKCPTTFLLSSWQEQCSCCLGLSGEFFLDDHRFRGSLLCGN